MRTGLALLSWIWLTLAPATADALPLGLDLEEDPNILGSFVTVSYLSSSDIFTASGFVFVMTDGLGDANDVVPTGFFSLTANIDNTGGLLGGTVTIFGQVPTLGFASGTLLRGLLTAFGFPTAGGDPLEFLFDVTGGDAAGLYGSAGGMFLDPSGFTGSFESDFSNAAGTATADVRVPVPEPSALLLVVLGAGLARARRGLRGV